MFICNNNYIAIQTFKTVDDIFKNVSIKAIHD